MMPPTPPASHYEEVSTNRKSDYAPIYEHSFRFMDQLEGWCSHEKAVILIDIILKNHPETVVEIGVFGGKSLIPMAVALQACEKGTIYGIDPWDSHDSVEGLVAEHKDWWGAIDHRKIFQDLVAKIQDFQLNNIVLIPHTSEEATPIEGIEVLHIDGNHSDDASYLDVTKWVPLVVSGGWVIFDDVDWHENGSYTTSRAVKWLDENCVKLAAFNDGHEWGIWLKP